MATIEIQMEYDINDNKMMEKSDEDRMGLVLENVGVYLSIRISSLFCCH
jgi:hypothetical protein